MNIVKIHSHLNGHEWLITHHPEILKEIETIVSKVDNSKAVKKAFKNQKNDFIKSRIGLQFDQYDSFAKHLAFYVSDTIDLGIEILPMKEMQEQMSSGPGYYEGALCYLARQGRGVPSVPLVLIGIAT